MNSNNSLALREAVIEELESVYDPEIPVNIFALGLIYEVKVEEERVIKDSVEMIERYNVLKLEAINRAAMILDNINIDSDYTVKGYKKIKPSFSKKIDMFIRHI